MTRSNHPLLYLLVTPFDTRNNGNDITLNLTEEIRTVKDCRKENLDRWKGNGRAGTTIDHDDDVPDGNRPSEVS